MATLHLSSALRRPFCVSAFSACSLVAGVPTGRFALVLMELNLCPEDLSSLLCLPEKSSTFINGEQEVEPIPADNIPTHEARTRCCQMILRVADVSVTRTCRITAITRWATSRIISAYLNMSLQRQS